MKGALIVIGFAVLSTLFWQEVRIRRAQSSVEWLGKEHLQLMTDFANAVRFQTELVENDKFAFQSISNLYGHVVTLKTNWDRSIERMISVQSNLNLSIGEAVTNRLPPRIEIWIAPPAPVPPAVPKWEL